MSKGGPQSYQRANGECILVLHLPSVKASLLMAQCGHTHLLKCQENEGLDGKQCSLAKGFQTSPPERNEVESFSLDAFFSRPLKYRTC